MDADRARQIAQLHDLHTAGILDDSALEAALARLESLPLPADAAGDALAPAVGERGAHIGGNVGKSVLTGDNIVLVEEGAHVYFGREQPVAMQAVDRESALGKYLTHVIARNRYLRLQGIRSGGRLVHIELEHIYITLRTTQQRTVDAEERWLEQTAGLAPGELRRHAGRETVTETVTVSVNAALAGQRRLVILGDPGSGKTTLLRYLALIYARDTAEGHDLLEQKLDLSESGTLPILLPLRQIGRFLQQQPDDGTDGHVQLLAFLQRHLEQERIAIPLDFFDAYLESGSAVILLDGLDEVPGQALRQRVARLVEAFTRAYPDCRYVVTSRIVGYSGTARLGEAYVTSTVQDFSLSDVAQFLTHWHRLVATGQMGPGPAAEAHASAQTRQLMDAIRAKPQIRDLAINPLMLTVIALVHRDRVKLPDRRAELYAEAVDVLLGKWDEAKGVDEPSILGDKAFDTGDRRLMLQALALHMHANQQKEIETGPLGDLLLAQFGPLVGDQRAAERARDRFLQVIEARTGLLVARGDGVYAFSHLTFQEYLAALAVAARDDYVAYTLARSGESWWREVILLEAGYLSTQSRQRTARLIAAIANRSEEPEPYHNLVLAAECLRDVGTNRISGEVGAYIQRQLRQGVEKPPPLRTRLFRGPGAKEWIERRSVAMAALVNSGAGFWTEPYGEPEWVPIPPGEFWVDKDRKQALAGFQIARVPVTNAQYALFVRATGYEAPKHWEDGRIPKGKESHPVVNVSWSDAIAYCNWLGEMIDKPVSLPSEMEWLKAARGDQDARDYPWGDRFDPLRCNTRELGIGDTTPVGIFPDGASPYGCLDMSGNVWEWCRNKYDHPDDDAIDDSGAMRALRGGSWNGSSYLARVASRGNYFPDYRGVSNGFRVVVRRPPSH